MSTSKPMDELNLHSLVDGEIAGDERAALHAVLRDDDKLAARVCEIARNKDLVALAYADVDPPQASHAAGGRIWAVAAGLIVAALLAASGVQVVFQDPPASRIVLLDPDGSGQQLADPTRDETRMVMHLKAGDMARTGEVLDELEAALEVFRQEGRPVRIELVAQGEGLELLREGLSRYPQRIQDLARRYDNLTFVACRNSVERIGREQDVEVKLLPPVVITRSGVNHVAKRQAQGWAYISI